jgi:hypothetical protein
MVLWRVVWTEVRVGVYETEAEDGTGARFNWQHDAGRDFCLGESRVEVHRVERANVNRE